MYEDEKNIKFLRALINCEDGNDRHEYVVYEELINLPLQTTL